MYQLENRYDAIDHYNYTHWPDSKYFKNYRFSPPISWYDNWSTRSRLWFPYYWSTSRLFQHYSQYRPSSRSLREQRKTIYLDYPRPIKAVDYSYYPYSYRTYRPLTLYYDYYWPLSSLNRYYWPHYPYYRYLYYKYTLPSDRYYHLKGKMLFLREPISAVPEYRVYPTASYLRHKVYKPLSLYCDYYYPIRSLFWNSSYWPLYRSVGSFADECPNGTGRRLQKIFDDETRLIRAQTASLLKRIHNPVPRVQRYSWPLAVTPKYYDDGLPARLTNDNYIHKLLITSSRNPRVEYTTYYTDPVRKYIGQGHLSCVSYAGERAHNRRPYIYLYEDPVRNDIQLLSYYINKFKQEKAITGSAAPESTKVALSPARPSRKFTAQNVEDNKAADEEMRKLREARAARLAFINEETKLERTSVDVDDAVKAKKKKDEDRLAEEKTLAEEQSRQELLAKKEEAARRAELARQEDLAAQAAAERAAELERQAELAKQQELAKQAEIERARKLEEERLRQEEERRREEEAKAEEERKQLQRLEEIAREAEEEKEAELARQAEELAEMARQEAELAELAQKEAELAELARQEEELAELARQEAELAELERKEKELTELAEQAKEEAEAARKDAELADYAQQEAELAELERQQAELDALDAEAKALAGDQSETEVEIEELPLEEESAPAEETATQEEDVVEEPAEEEEDEDAKRQREMDDLVREKFELAELERQQAELDALDAEAKALAGDDDNVADDDEEEPAIAEDTPVQSDVEE